MRVLLQRVSEARVEIEDETVGAVGRGLLLLFCAEASDDDAAAAARSRRIAQKIAKLRVFADDEGRMNRSVTDVAGAALVVSQFTLAADLSRGNRPGFSRAAPPERGEALYETFVRDLAAADVPVQTGRFGAEMALHLVNDGPVTIWINDDSLAVCRALAE